MTLDIAQAPPVSQNPAGGGPPGAGPPTPADAALVFAAMLAQQKPPNAGQTAGAGPKTADDLRDDKTRSDQNDKKGDKDAPDDPALSGLSPVSVQTLPTEAIPLAVSLVPLGLPVPIALAPIAAAASSAKTSEAMDTSLSGAPAPPGGTALPTGGELLPQTVQTSASTAEHAPALFSLPGVVPPPAPAFPAGSVASAPAFPAGGAASGQPVSAPAGVAAARVQSAPLEGEGAAQGRSLVPSASAAAVGLLGSPATAQAVRPAVASALPASASAPEAAFPAGASAAANAAPASGAALASSPATKIALQGYAQFGQIPLQNTGRPANNTGKAGSALAPQSAAAMGKNAFLQNSLPQTPPSPAPAEADAWAGQEWTRAAKTEADNSGDKPGAPGDEVSGTVPMPMTPGASETKTATVSVPPMLPQERAALMQQAADSVQALHAQVLGHGRGQMTLQLHPQDWGKLQVSVLMTPDTTGSGGTRVTAHLVADSAAVKQALETNGSDLRRTLREAGLHLENMTVTVRPPAASSEAQSMGGGFSGDPRQSASQDAQAWPAPGSRGENAAGMAAGNGGTAFSGGGANTGAQNRERIPTTLPGIGMADDYEEQAPQAISASGTASRLDTRA